MYMMTKFPGTPAPETDPYWASVWLLIPGNGANNGTTIIDVSSNNRAITLNGNVKTITAQSQWGGSSIDFDGTDDFLSVAGDADFLLDYTEDWTVEAWIRCTNLGTFRCLFQHGDNGVGTSPSFTFNLDAGNPYYGLQNTTAGSETPNGGAVSVNTWAHVAATFTASDGSMDTWLNGALAGTNTKPSGSPSSPGTNLRIGSYLSGAFDFIGQMNDIRITKGVNRYTASFSVPTAAFPTS